MRPSRVLAATVAAIALAGFAGCGDDGADDDGSAADAPPAATQPAGGGAATNAAPPAGGGVSGEEETEVKKAVETYNAALASSDSGRLCELMSSSARASFLDQAEKSGVDGDCPAALDKSLGQISDQLAAGGDALRGAEVTDVRIDGDEAAVSLTFDIKGRKTTRPYAAVKENGEWKVAQDPAG